jgi:hypothetical protein
VTYESQQKNRGIPVRTRVRRFSMCEKWAVGGVLLRPDRDSLEVGADEYGSILWTRGGIAAAFVRREE